MQFGTLAVHCSKFRNFLSEEVVRCSVGPEHVVARLRSIME